MLGVVKLLPVLNALPPVKEPYHEIVPPTQPLAVKLTVPVPQLLPPVLVAAFGIVVIVANALLLLELIQPLKVQSI